MASRHLRLLSQVQCVQGKVPNYGSCAPPAPITLPPEARALALIPESATFFTFAFPLAGVGALSKDSRTAFLAAGTDPNWRFICYGGFLYFDGEGRVVAANALGEGDALRF